LRRERAAVATDGWFSGVLIFSMEDRMKRITAVLAVAAGLIAACNREPSAPRVTAASTATTPGQYSQEFSLPVGATTTTEVTGCDNSPGPYITISGAMRLAGLGARTGFTNNVKGTHTYTTDSHVDVTVLPSGGSITIPKQPVLGGVGGNPFIWIQFEDGNGHALSDEFYLGRCVQGLKGSNSIDWASAARALATLTVSDCSNSPGPYITLYGDMLVKSGLDAVFMFANNDNPVGGPHRATADKVVKVSLVPPGMDIRFNKQPSQGGVGGNPWIWFNFLNGSGSPLGDPALIGRCEQLSKT
jgi:hypothetical protein